jgi:asparagine synthase (glutamine-hydrolysing)
MGNALIHRGPDDAGKYSSGPLLMGMRRLAIIDVAGGHQPISNEDGSVWTVCNGEIYGFRRIKQQLEQRGHHFRTNSDSEVLVHLYEDFGDDLVAHIDGMYCFAIWDEAKQRLLLGRDRLGIKPLYLLKQPHRLIFASELKGITALPGFERRIDHDALREYLSLGYVPAPYSILRGVEKLPPASLLISEGGVERTKQYWRMPAAAAQRLSEAEWIARVRSELERAVQEQMVSDVPVGAFLSGGIDSSAVVALMARLTDKPVRTYSIGFDTRGSVGQYYNELPYAKIVAERFETAHREILVNPDCAELLPRLIWQLDEPIADSAFVTTYLVSEFARREVTVTLSGVGGDELFGGYRRYLGEHYSRMYERVPATLRKRVLGPLARRLPSDRHSPLLNTSRLVKKFILSGDQTLAERYRGYVQVIDRTVLSRLLVNCDATRPDALDRAFDAADGSGDALRQLMDVDLTTQLPDDLLALTDRMTMATSLECRVPFLDVRLVEVAAHMPSEVKIRGGELKYALKRAMQDLLPKEILNRSKRGFGAPLGAWIKNELKEYLHEILSEDSVRARGLLEWPVVHELMEQHATGREDNTDHLLGLMNLELWCRVYLDRADPSELTESLRRAS